jgi:hypothetical protein
VPLQGQPGVSPGILLTSGERPGDLASLRELPINAYLLKPLRQDEEHRPDDLGRGARRAGFPPCRTGLQRNDRPPGLQLNVDLDLKA